MNGPEIEFDWDEANIGHVARHSVLPEEAEQVILNDLVDLGMEIVEGEERYLNLGATVQHRILLVVTTCSVLLQETREVISYGQETATLQD